MKYIKSKLAFSIVLLSTSCFATPKPAACPTVAAIKSVGLQEAGTSLMGWQVGIDKNHFGTKEVWGFVMILGGDKSPNEAAAIATGNSKISSLVLYSGPDENNGRWECSYIIPNEDDNHHTFGIAVTVPENGN